MSPGGTKADCTLLHGDTTCKTCYASVHCHLDTLAGAGTTTFMIPIVKVPSIGGITPEICVTSFRVTDNYYQNEQICGNIGATNGTPSALGGPTGMTASSNLIQQPASYTFSFSTPTGF